MRRLFSLVSFIPDWRIDDLMVSFAAPGGGVGPHRDNYDVFLCQGIGVREWHVTEREVPSDPEASNDIALTQTFSDQAYAAQEGDVLYLPPGAPHWGTAKRACITYSIGMRAPQLSDLVEDRPDDVHGDPFFTDPDLAIDEALPGYISVAAAERAASLVSAPGSQLASVSTALGQCATRTKDWITPDLPDTAAVASALEWLNRGHKLDVHGMSRIAWSDSHAFVNGRAMLLPPDGAGFIAGICRTRSLEGPLSDAPDMVNLATWALRSGAFEIPGTF